MAFLFVDRILSLNPGQHITGLKHITAHDKFLSEVEARPALLDCIIGETLGQLAAWNVMQTMEFSKRPVAGVASNVEMLSPAFVGETLYLEAWIDSLDEQAVSYHGQVTVGSRKILTLGSALGPLLPMTDFIDESLVRQQFTLINRPGDFACEVNQKPIQDLISSRVKYESMEIYDHILEWQAGERAVVSKAISRLAPYFVDHFPSRPVFPMTLLLNANLHMGMSLLSQEGVYVKAIRRAKMNQFVEPGDVIQTECEVKRRDTQSAIISFQTTVAGKRICVCEAEYGFNSAGEKSS